SGDPCGECESCLRIWNGGASLDVVEIDAASNRGVDDARELRERAMYAPSEEDRYKVYIIDEAHMLTREAWNALLKILEEPPPRVIFVFATTEPQKIQQAAPPILSRCQRFDFHRISTGDLVARLRTVLGAEGIEAGDDVLVPIAQKADGGMRDGLSLLDQVLSFTEGVPTPDDVRRILGLVGTEVYLELFGVIAERRPAEVFRFVGRLLQEGYDLAEFYRGLADFLRALLIVRLDGGEAEGVPPHLHPAVRECAFRFAPGDLLRMLAQVAELDADGRFRKSGEQRILIELLLLRFAYLESTVSLEDVLAAVGGGRPGGGAPGNGPGRPASPEPRAGRPSEPATAPASSAPAAQPAPAPAPAAAGPEPVAAPPVAAPPVPVESAPAPVQAAAQAVAPAPAPPAPVEMRAAREPEADQGPPAPVWEGYDFAEPADAAPAAARAPEPDRAAEPARAPEPPIASDGPLDPARVKRAWTVVVDAGEGVPQGTARMLKLAKLEVSGRAVTVEAPPVVLGRFDGAGAKRPLEAALSRELGGAVTLEFRAGASTAEQPGGHRITAESAKRDRLERMMEGEPVLTAAVKAWNLELTD
ncbi:MAG TPA: DNA polymerase III subunit gamma/tau, partial [Longimicrobium sp.]|nr:DNA polymerase III subunit gamma/tau [Longimicrobium sp.]